MIKTLTKYRIPKHRLLLNVIFLLLSLCIVNISFAAEDFPWELFYPAFIKKSIDKDKDGFTKEQGDCNDNDDSIYPGADEVCIEVTQDYIHLDSGMLKIGLDLLSGGAIYYLSRSTENRNLVNIHDQGRYIQQSYYAGNSINRQNEGQSIHWSPWPWNPIQAGDAFDNSPEVVESDIENGVVYTKTLPLLWDMNNERAECFFEQWTTLHVNTVHVRNKLTIFRTDTLYGENILNGQELPAVYPISALSNLYTYMGSTPFSNAPVDNPDVVNLSSGFWGEYPTVTEHWMAFVDNNQWGMGVYNHKCIHFLAGMAGITGGEARDGSTSYIAPVKTEILNNNTIYEYVYYIIIGTVDEIRSIVYELDSQQSPQQNKWEFNEDNNLEGWVPNGSATAIVANGRLHLDITGNDPYMTQQEGLTINASEFNTLVVKMKNNTTDTNCDFFFKSADMPNEYRRIRFKVIPNDTILRDYTIELEDYPEWSGIIFHLRLDPVSGVSSGSVDIDYIHVEKGL